MLAPVLAGMWALGSLIDEGLSARVRRTAIVAVACVGAVCLNPFGIGLPLYAISLFTSPFKSMITEWKRTDLGDPSFGYGSLPLLLCAAAFGVRGDGKWRDRLMLVAIAVLMFSAARNVGIFALAIMPIVAAALTREVPFLAMPKEEPKTKVDRIAGRLIPVFSVMLAVGIMFGLLQSEARSETSQPIKALAALRVLPGTHRVFCADFAWCSFVIEDNSGSVFLDGRADPYPMAVWNDFSTVVRLRPGWRSKLDSHRVDTVLVARDAPLEQGLQLASDWRVAYHDKKYDLWERKAMAVSQR
jgi:branched-subunit amino acid transport protein AzlD